jgi:hypothetical protein
LIPSKIKQYLLNFRQVSGLMSTHLSGDVGGNVLLVNVVVVGGQEPKNGFQMIIYELI